MPISFMQKVAQYKEMLAEGRSSIPIDADVPPPMGVDTVPARLEDGEFVMNREGVAEAEATMPGFLETMNNQGLAARQQGIDANPAPTGPVAPGAEASQGINSVTPQGEPVYNFAGGGMVDYFNKGGYFNQGLEGYGLKDQFSLGFGGDVENPQGFGEKAGVFAKNFLGGFKPSQLVEDYTSGAERQRAELLGGDYLSNYRADQKAATAANTTGTYGRPLNIEFRDKKGVFGPAGQNQVRAARIIDGEYVIQDDEGEWKSVSEVIGHNDYQVTGRTAQEAVEEGAGGIPNAESVNKNGTPVFDFKRDSEAKNYGYAIRAIKAHEELKNFENTNPEAVTSAWRGVMDTIARGSAGGNFAPVLQSAFGDYGLTEYAKSVSRFLQAVLRRDTGAAYTETEFNDYAFAFGVTPGGDIRGIPAAQSARYNELISTAGSVGKAGPYVGGLLDGTYQLPTEGKPAAVSTSTPTETQYDYDFTQ